jgi:hypothetical protein
MELGFQFIRKEWCIVWWILGCKLAIRVFWQVLTEF